MSREAFRRTGSQRKTALAHGVARATVQAILREAMHDHPAATLLVI